jgi:POT family proton-dependent oligopeptide transporter
MSVQTEEADAQGKGGPELKAPGVLSHPRGLYFLFTTEMWERFSYYGMRAMLVPYMLVYLQFQPAASSSTYKWYTSLVYLTPLIGGFLADKFLGLRMSILIGGVLMAMGQFLLTVESMPMFYLALALLIAGNGFFKPNISTMVGKMYKPGDPRRDGAFTIFYMGINLGAFLAPFVCGTLRVTKGPHWGFAAAGIGMLLGLGVFLVGQNRVLADIEAAGNQLKAAEKKKAEAASSELDPDEQKPAAEGIPKMVRTIAMPLINALALTIAIYYAFQVSKGHEKPTSLIMPIGFLGVFVWMTITLNGIKGAAKDKSTVIFVLFLAAVLFWMAFEQAGNTLNIWAITHTDLHLGSWEYPAEYFQSVNAVLIFVLGIPFASLWVYLAKKGKEPSTPMKMFVGLVLCGLSFVPMVLAAQSEDSTTTSVDLDALPKTVDVSKMNAGRLTYDPAAKKLTVRGVLPIFVVNDALTKTTDPKYIALVKELEEKAADASEKKPVAFSIPSLPSGWKFPLDADEAKKLELKVEGNAAENKKMKVKWTDTSADFVMTGTLDAPTKGNLIAAGAPPEFREPIRKLEKDSQRARVSSLWLILSYLIATLGELCLSPVGLSMVTKLAPGRVASLFMGVWLLASSVAQYAGGTLGEMWGEITPTKYFSLFVWICFIGSAVLLAAVRPLRKLMHEVH